MKRVAFTQNSHSSAKYFYVSACDLAKVKARKWYAKRNSSGYISVASYATPQERALGYPKTIRLARFLMICNVGHFSQVVDHVDGNPLNNTRENLRLATHAENARNTKLRKDNKCGFKGVRKSRNKWRATITVHGEAKNLGSFDTAEEAHDAYKFAAEFYFKNFARLI